MSRWQQRTSWSPSEDESVAEVIDLHIAEVDIDLAVMGLCGRPRLQEEILGGVSRHMLERGEHSGAHASRACLPARADA